MRKVEKIFVIVFFCIICFFLVTTFFNNQKVSWIEQRTLTTFPKFSINNLTNKKYYDELTSAFSDQLELREQLIKGYFLFQFQRYYGTVAIGEDNQMYTASQKKVSDSYYDNLANTIKLVNKESEKISAKFIFLSIPRKDAYMTKELPSNYNSSKEVYEKQVRIARDNLGKDIIFIDAYEVFKNNNQYYCYYSNDHHITPRCAYSLYKEINNYTQVSSYELEKEFEIGQTIINGAYNRQVGQKVKHKAEDLYLIPKINISYKRYEDEKLSNKKVFGKGNTYEDAYMEGDNAFTRIVTNNNSKNIMFVGSSYTNILEALSVPSYKEVLSIDYRHNKTGRSIKYYVDKYNIDYVVFVPAQSNNSYSLDKIKLHLGIINN